MSIRFLTAGESHGPALVGIIEGLPSGIEVSESSLLTHMESRKQGYGRGARQKIETDHVEILSGVRFGKTLGTPIGLVIKNKDFSNWQNVMSVWGDKTSHRKVSVPRPGHADAVGAIKYEYDDLRNSLERASARETATRVALGYFAKAFISSLGIEIKSRVISIGKVIDQKQYQHSEYWDAPYIEEYGLRVLDSQISKEMKELIDFARESGDTLGGSFETRVANLPLGLGSYSQWDRKIEAKIGASFLSLNAIKSVEIGLGAISSSTLGSQVHDSMSWSQANGLEFSSNNAGGTLAGVTTGQEFIVKAHMKPIATLMKPLDSFNWKTKESAKAHVERSDYCAAPSASVISESLVALDIAQLVLEKFGGDSLFEILPRVEQWREHCKS